MKNLTIKQKIVGVLLAILALFGVGVGTGNLGGVGVTSEYRIATTTMDAAIGQGALICGARQTFGGITISSVGVGSGVFNFYDGTTTLAHTGTPTTTIASFATASAIGNYPYDVVLRYGLVFTNSGAMGSTTVFCR